jgi:molybdopterin converting factor small subunit
MMIEVKIFGQLTDITEKTTLQLEDCNTVSELKQKLYEKYPTLKEKKFNIAIGNKLSNSDDNTINGQILSLLPPYSGG